MWSRGVDGFQFPRRFFYNDIIQGISLELLLQEAYILVRHCNFTYKDVKEMSRLERAIFLKNFSDEKEAEKNEFERIRNS